MAACDTDTGHGDKYIYPIYVKNREKTTYGTCFIIHDYIITCNDIFDDFYDDSSVFTCVGETEYECEITYKIFEYGICFLKPTLNNPHRLFNNDVSCDFFLNTSLIPDGSNKQKCSIKYTKCGTPTVNNIDMQFEDITFNKITRQSAPLIPIYEFKLGKTLEKTIDKEDLCGGVVCDENNKLIGMMLSYNIKHDVFFVLPIYVIMSFFDKHHMVTLNKMYNLSTIFIENFTKPVTVKNSKYTEGLTITETCSTLKLHKIKLNIGDVIVSINNKKIIDGWIPFMNICVPPSTYFVLHQDITDIPITIIKNKKIINTTIDSLISVDDLSTIPLLSSPLENIDIEQFGLNLVQLSEDIIIKYRKEHNKNIVGVARDLFENKINLNMDFYYVVKTVDYSKIESNDDLLMKYEKFNFPMLKTDDVSNDYALFLLTKVNNKKLKSKLSDYDLEKVNSLTFVTTNLKDTIKISIK